MVPPPSLPHPVFETAHDYETATLNLSHERAPQLFESVRAPTPILATSRKSLTHQNTVRNLSSPLANPALLFSVQKKIMKTRVARVCLYACTKGYLYECSCENVSHVEKRWDRLDAICSLFYANHMLCKAT